MRNIFLKFVFVFITILLTYISVAQVNADFTSDKTSGCVGTMLVNFSDQSSGVPTSWQWNFGDGASSTQQNPGHNYLNPGTYTVTLTASNIGSSDTETKTAFIDITIATITNSIISDTNNVYPETNILFTGFSNSPASIIMWEWDFGDGDTVQSTANLPQKHQYDNSGEYFVTLTVTDIDGCTAFFKYKITIIEGIETANIFTPNGDGKNDFFFIRNGGMKEHYIVIFNRWGEKIYENTSGEIQWYGKNFAGAEVPDGTYFYILQSTRENGEVIKNKNSITLMR